MTSLTKKSLPISFGARAPRLTPLGPRALRRALRGARVRVPSSRLSRVRLANLGGNTRLRRLLPRAQQQKSGGEIEANAKKASLATSSTLSMTMKRIRATPRLPVLARPAASCGTRTKATSYRAPPSAMATPPAGANAKEESHTQRQKQRGRAHQLVAHRGHRAGHRPAQPSPGRAHGESRAQVLATCPDHRSGPQVSATGPDHRSWP